MERLSWGPGSLASLLGPHPVDPVLSTLALGRLEFLSPWGGSVLCFHHAIFMVTRFPLDRPGWKPGGSGWESALGILFLPVFPPVPQLRVDEAPHEPGLDNTHQQQHAEPARQGVKVPFLGVKHLVFHPSQSEADGQDGESEDEEARAPKHGSPGVKQPLVVLICEVEEPGHVEKELGGVLQQQQDQAQATQVQEVRPSDVKQIQANVLQLAGDFFLPHLLEVKLG